MLRLILLRVLESYFRHRWLYLIPILLMVPVAVLYFMMAEDSYTTSGVIRVQEESFLASINSVRQDGLPSWIDPSQVVSDELNELLQTDAFVRAMVQQTKLEERMSGGPYEVYLTLLEARSSVYAAPVGRNQVQVVVTHEDPDVAYELANAAIENQVLWKINNERNESRIAEEFFNELAVQYKADLDDARSALQEYLIMNPAPIRGQRPGAETVEIDGYEADVQLAHSRYVNALTKIENAKLATAQTESDVRQTYYLIDAPFLPTESNLSTVSKLIAVVALMAAGVVVSAVLVVLNAIVDRSFRFPLDVQQGLDLPVLATVPQVKLDKSAVSRVAVNPAQAAKYQQPQPRFKGSRT